MSASAHHGTIVLTQPATAYDPELMKATRGARFEAALQAFIKSKGEAWDEKYRRAFAADLVADMLHFCDLHGLKFEEIHALGANHYRNECEDDADVAQLGVISSLPPIPPH
jgi:hypothetical protein